LGSGAPSLRGSRHRADQAASEAPTTQRAWFVVGQSQVADSCYDPEKQWLPEAIPNAARNPAPPAPDHNVITVLGDFVGSCRRAGS